MKITSILAFSLLAGAAGFAGAPSGASAMPLAPEALQAAAPSAATDVQYRRRAYRHRRAPRITIYGGRGPYLPPQTYYNGGNRRGFYDPGYAYQGNINGCAVDLGYGRYESCNVGR